MPYNLLYSRSISSDDRVRFTDVPINEASIMVDILSLRSPFYRIAGYIYSITSDGVIDFERGAGYTVPFGKNRLLFPSQSFPYFLEFFPKWGTRQAIVSVYTGSPTIDDSRFHWVQQQNASRDFALQVPLPGMVTRLTSNYPSSYYPAPNAIEGFLFYDRVHYKNADGTYINQHVTDASDVISITQSDYELLRSDGASRQL